MEDGLYVYMNRLREYEDTGLTPEEITDGKMFSGWIPCNERLPEEKTEEDDIFDPVSLATVDVRRYKVTDLVAVTVKDIENGEVFVSDDMMVDGEWVDYTKEYYKTLAWSPLPEPYQD